MDDTIRDVAQRLYYKVNRLNVGKVATVGVAKSNQGKDLLVVYFLEGSSFICPEKFEGHMVVTSTARQKQEARA